ncbi:hypothetical protein BFG04_00700 [Campylobacter pinnipediorum subsp. pinnipediorum]|uniref:Ferrochelatase n=1 Tax=Campylobacter pinnipediorum subsp. pinnipediorum TaxID=1660067 RepID=A0AAX0LBR3_9BACT|nr:hypothetical protein [Campylobacter pinnipediorum]OPA81693.1 hypothetical protein BFG04_00700 [Campylobacter pinnipediorum subsp. pinnipediorum]
MRLENLCRLLNGILLNNPAISEINEFGFDAKAIKRGYAFFSNDSNEDDISQAINNGAYAIIATKIGSIQDKEIAYIKVEDIRLSVIRLVRFMASEKSLVFYHINKIQKSIISNMHIKNAKLLPNRIDDIFKVIQNANFNEIFFSDDIEILNQLSPNYQSTALTKNIETINSNSMFFVNFIFDEIFYQNINIPQIFLKDLCPLLETLSGNNIHFKLNEIKSLDHFEPIFIDKNFYPVSFGTSFRAIIVENDIELFKLEANYLANKFNQSDIIITASKDTKLDIENIVYFKKLDDIKSFKNFRYVLMLCNKEELMERLNEKEEATLF